ncbi:hypothetical protein [Taklimakanibacter deserti]
MMLLSDTASFLGAIVAGMALGGLLYAGAVIAWRLASRIWRWLRRQ